MNKKKTVTLLIVFFLILIFQQITASNLITEVNNKLIRIKIKAENPGILMTELDVSGFDVLFGSIKDSTFEIIVSSAELRKIKSMGLEIISQKPGRPLKEILNISDDSVSNKSGIPLGYSNYQGIIDRMESIASNYPNIATVINITNRFNTPQTADGKDIYGIKISDNVNLLEDEPRILIVATEHAREIINPVIALHTIEKLTKNYGIDTDITNSVNNSEIWIIPVLNPDGYEYVINIDNNWRKNRRVFDEAIGVDLNRNFPFGWDDSCSGSTNISSPVYKGPSPLSEVESQSVSKMFEELRFAKYLDLHSYGSEVVLSYSNCSSHPWHEWVQSEGKLISSYMGYDKTRSPSASGELYQWFLSKGTYSFLIETGTYFQPKYNIALQEAEKVWPGILSVINREIPLEIKIADSKTHNPIHNARIEFPDINFYSGEIFYSGQFGKYYSFMPAGSYKVKISAEGYNTFEQYISVIDEYSTFLNVKLDPKVFINKVSGRQISNRSLIQIEYINILNWETISLNDNSSILGFKIYEIKDMEKNLLVEVNASTSEYYHRDQKKGENKVYWITVIDDQGNETEPYIFNLLF